MSYIALPSVDKTDDKKYQLIVDHFVPDATFKFPKDTNSGRSFQYNFRWLAKYPWLRYSEKADGGFCLACVLFFQSSNFCSEPGLLVYTPLTDFKRALGKLDHHSDRVYHKAAIVKMDEFVKVMAGRQPNIQSQLDDVCAAQISQNQQKIKSIILCGRQNISLRGHRDSSLDLERDETASHGNFWALLHFRAAAGDLVLREHRAHAPRNATYTSPDVQNQIIDILGDYVRRKILSQLQKAQFFTLIADDVTDCSNKEQLSLVLRYVDRESNQIREDLVAFIECDTGVSGRDLANKMLSFLRRHRVDLTKLCGQA